VHAADVERIKIGSAAIGWAGNEQLLMRTTEELIGTKDLSDASWAAVRAAYDERTAIELLLLIGHYDMLATTLMTLRLEPDPPR
jgi:alkylhydroperoxidase family enzyme